MDRLSKYEPLLIFLAILIGFLIGFNPTVAEICSHLEEPLLLVLLFIIFFEIDYNELKESFKNLKFILTETLINFVWTPVLAYLLATVFLSNFNLQLALLLLLIMPCTDWYLVFTNLTGGNVSLSSAILPINLILQLALLPLYLAIFFGITQNINYSFAYESFVELLIPIVLAVLAKFFLSRFESFRKAYEKFDDYLDHAEIFMVCLIAIVIFASYQEEIFNIPLNFPGFILVLILFYTINFIFSLLVGKRLKFNKKDQISLVFTTTARNTPLSLTVAALLFPDQKLMPLVLLIGAITELPFSTFESFLLKRFNVFEKHKLETR